MSLIVYLDPTLNIEEWNTDWNQAGATIISPRMSREIETDDFKGFYFNGHHSSEFNIIRTSSSNRYNENFTLTLNDKTVDVPNGDGKYYFGTTYKERTFTVNYAFDSMTEENLRAIKHWLSGKELSLLIFDEEPYKVYTAKVTGNSQAKYLCFTENDQRVYKGEGSIAFTCYYPFARTPDEVGTYVYNNDEETYWLESDDGKKLGAYVLSKFTNRNEWIDAAKILEDYRISKTYTDNDNDINIQYYEYLNLGDVPAPFVAEITGQDINVDDKIKLEYNGNTIAEITFKQAVSGGDIIWDSKTGIIKYIITGNE